MRTYPLTSIPGPWSEHGTNWYNCNRYDEASGVEARDAQAQSRASLERYLHVREIFIATTANRGNDC